MKTLCVGILFLLALVGCVTPKMTPNGQTHYRFESEHTKDQAAAFNAAELALAQMYGDYREVLKFRQPETGTLLLGGIHSYHAMTRRMISPYGLKVVVNDRSVVLDFDLQLSSDPASFYWPPANEMPKIEAEFEAISRAISESIGGTNFQASR